jgi:tRNA pseudouridine55 synthase
MDLIICLNKPKGLSSHKAVTKIKKIFKAHKAGHTGTLDPTATGVLLVCLNRSTRLASYFTSLNKEYKVVMKLGETTDTQDAEGTVIKKTDRINIDRNMLKHTFKSFEGETLQKPPMFSALKHKGKPLYKYAKKGLEIPIEPRKVSIHHIELLTVDTPFVSFKALCSKGTYMRTLCNDIGEKLGIGAHLFELERTAVGPFTILDSLNMEELDTVNVNKLPNRGIDTMDSALSWMPELKIKESLLHAVKNGAPIKINDFTNFSDTLKTDSSIKIKSPDGEFIAVGRFVSGKKIVKMDVVFGT